MPLDIVDLFHKAPKLKGDIVCLLLVIVLKESVFTSCVFQGVDVQGLASKRRRCESQADAQSLGAGVVSLEERVHAYVDVLKTRFQKACIEASSSPKYHLEVSQMAQQGTGRFLGSCRLMTALGIVSKSDEDDAALAKSSKRRRCESQADAQSLGAGVVAGLVSLGNTWKYNVLENDSERLKEFVRDALSCEEQWQKALASDDFEYVACTTAAIVEKSRIEQLCMHTKPKKNDKFLIKTSYI